MIRVKIRLYGLNLNEEHGTYNPACANTIAIPNALINVVLPTAFVPYNNIPSVFPSPREISLATYNSFN